MVRDQLERSLALSGGLEVEEGQKYALRRGLELEDLATDFSYFEGEWFDCLHTTLMVFNGNPADKHIVEQVGCDLGKLGTVSKVGQSDQTLMMDIYLLNHCFFHDLGGNGQDPCPNDLLPDDSRGDGNVLVKYSMKGIGSFADANKIEFFSDHTYLKDESGEWQINFERAKIENMDTMVCHKHLNGIVCDWHINEYRTSTKITTGCEKNGKCKTEWNENKCTRKDGTWTDTCVVKRIADGFVYDSFGSYYLVKTPDECTLTCDTDESGDPDPEENVTGCYRGGQCLGANGCCDCSIKDEQSCVSNANPGILSDGCRPICLPEVEDGIGCYKGGECAGANGCCDCSIKDEESCENNENPGIFFSEGCEPICL